MNKNIPFKWQDENKWMESMKGRIWDTAIQDEQTRFHAIVTSLSPLVHTIDNELDTKDTYKEEYTDEDGSFYVCDDGKGAELYKLHQKNKDKDEDGWTYDKAIGPFVAHLHGRVYCIEAEKKRWYRRLISLDESGKDRKMLLEVEDPRWNLELMKGQNKCLFLRGNNAGQQALWYITKDGILQDITNDCESFVPIGFSKEGDVHYFARKKGSSHFEGFGPLLKKRNIPLSKTVPEYYSLEENIYVSRRHGIRTVWSFAKGNKTTKQEVIGSIEPNTQKDWNGITNTLIFHDLKEDTATHVKYLQTRSNDGTIVHFILVCPAEQKSRRVLITGYGAYGMPTRLCMKRWKPLVKRGFAICFALIRGGGDHDDSWAESARRDMKIRSIEDFEAIIQATQKYLSLTAHDTTIYGRSAGGYLVGATLGRNASGNLFNTVYTEVPYLDVFTTTTNSTLPLTELEYDEFGNPLQRLQDATAILRLSPMDILPETGAPTITVLCRTGLNDTEVYPYESMKWITKLRKLQGGLGMNKLLAITADEGHFVFGKMSRKERAEDLALLLSFSNLL